MERVTFQDEELVARLRETCVATWRNVLPGFQTANIDDPAFRGGVLASLRGAADSRPGQASQNIATVFSLPDGRVLHVAPGLFGARDLLRELEFALSLRHALTRAQGNPIIEELTAIEWHAARPQSPVLNDALRELLSPVHATLARRPLLPLEELRLADYTDAKLDAKATLAQGKELVHWVDRANRPPPPVKPRR